MSCVQGVHLSHCTHLALRAPFPPLEDEVTEESRRVPGGRALRAHRPGGRSSGQVGKGGVGFELGRGERGVKPAPTHICRVRM